MKIFLPLAAAVLLVSCSDAPTETKAKEPPKALEPVTGRQAFQATYPSARGWAADAEPLQIRSMNLSGTKSEEGKAGVWEIAYVSPSHGSAKIYTWSATEDGNIHQGVFGGQQQSWSQGGQQSPFTAAAIKTDTPEALQEAIKASDEFLKSPGEKPAITYMLDFTPRFPDPVWRVLWGASAGSAKRQVFVDAVTGKVLGKE